MSLTELHNVYGAIHETALNDLLTAFCTDRPRYLAYGSPAFVPVTTVAETNMPAIAFPGVPGGIQWRVRLSIPQVDLFKQSAPLPPELSLTKDHFSASIAVQICLGCAPIRIDPKPPRPPKGEVRPTGHAAAEGKPSNKATDIRHPIAELTCCTLRVFVIGHVQHVLASNGEDAIALAVDAVEIVDIAPAELESLLECLLFMILQAMLAEIRLPLRALRAGAFQLSLGEGPLIEDDQIKVRGSF
jgi:hypothetical protein